MRKDIHRAFNWRTGGAMPFRGLLDTRGKIKSLKGTVDVCNWVYLSAAVRMRSGCELSDLECANVKCIVSF